MGDAEPSARSSALIRDVASLARCPFHAATLSKKKADLCD